MAPKEESSEVDRGFVRRTADWRQVGNYEAATIPRHTLADKIFYGVRYINDLTYVFAVSVFLIIYSLIRLMYKPGDNDIKGAIAVISGGGNGLGKAIAIELVAHGARVAIADVDGKAARDTAEELCIRSNSRDAAKAYVADVSKPDDVNRLRDKITKDFGEPATIIVNNAGVIPTVSLTEGTDDDITRVMDVNCNSQFWMLRAFLPALKQLNKGHIVTISSLSGEMGLSRAVVYATTKAAVRCLSTSLQDELRDDGYDGIHVSIAYPYFIATRKTIYDIVKLRVPPVTPESAAKTIVNGMLKNTLHIGVPAPSIYLVSLLRMCPDSVMQLFRKTFTVDIPSMNK